MSRESLNEFVDIQISRETQIIEGENFKNVLFISDDKPFFEAVRVYGTTSAMLTDGFTATSNAYLAAQKHFSQTPRPSNIYIGRRDYTASTITFDATDIVGLTDYVISRRAKNATNVSTDVSAVETAGAGTGGVCTGAAKVTEVTRIVDAWETAINASAIASSVTVTKTASSITLTPVVGHEIGVLSLTDGLDRASTYETWPTALATIEQENSNWYGVASYSSDKTDILAIAAEIETRKKIYGFSTTAVESKAVTESPVNVNDVLGLVEELNYERTFGVWHDDDAEFIEVAIMGKKLQAIAGATIWKFTTLSAVASDALTLTESTNIRAKSGNAYQEVAGQNILREGTMASGEFIDIMHGADDLHSRIQTEVYRHLLVTANGGSKVPLTDAGMKQISNIVETEIRRSITNGFIKSTVDIEDAAGQIQTISGYEIIVPLVSSLSANDRAQRIAPTIKFNAVLAGAVHKTIIRGSLTV